VDQRLADGLNGRDLTERPLTARRQLLVSMLEDTSIPFLHLMAAFEEGHALFATVEELGLEVS